MSNTFEALGLKWPNTGRRVPEGAKLEAHHVHEPWADLVYWDERRGLWVYVSTLPWHDFTVSRGSV